LAYRNGSFSLDSIWSKSGLLLQKSEKENTKGGIKYDSVMAEIQAKYQ
jgi:hypothetical protein